MASQEGSCETNPWLLLLLLLLLLYPSQKTFMIKKWSKSDHKWSKLHFSNKQKNLSTLEIQKHEIFITKPPTRPELVASFSKSHLGNNKKTQTSWKINYLDFWHHFFRMSQRTFQQSLRSFGGILFVDPPRPPIFYKYFYTYFYTYFLCCGLPILTSLLVLIFKNY